MPIVHYQGAQVCSSIRVADGRCNVLQNILPIRTRHLLWKIRVNCDSVTRSALGLAKTHHRSSLCQPEQKIHVVNPNSRKAKKSYKPKVISLCTRPK